MPYTLEPYKSPSTRHTCPNCGSPRQFARYINTETHEYLADHVGRCNREQNCAYHYTPKQYFHDHPETTPLSFLQREGAGGEFFQSPRLNPRIVPSCSRDVVQSPYRPSPHLPVTPSSIPAHLFHQFLLPKPPFSNFQIPKFSNPPSFISESIFHNSLSNYSHNHFLTFLKSIFNPSTITQLINTYLIGTSKTWPASTVFWQIDTNGNIRDGKIMLYDPTTGCRVKHPFNHITWAHSALKLKEYNLQQCFFGEHLLKLHPGLPVSIVESEKTAIIASVYFPQFIWLATGGKHGCKWTSPQVFNVLKGRHITLWPDIKAYDDWNLKARELQKSGLHITISNLLEQLASPSEREAGLDLADYLIKFDYKLFIKQTTDPVGAFPQTINSSQSSALVSNSPPLQKPFSQTSEDIRQYYLDELDKSKKSIYNKQSDLWDNEIQSLESFFSSIQLPEPPLRLNQCTVILNLPGFISDHIETLRFYNGNPVFLPCLKRLQLLQKILTTE
ncbi:MAG: DUF6371 domain-containing protein [Bacteroidota bacterium]